MMSGDKVIVTGGCGMIGSNLTKKLVDIGGDVYVVDNLWRGKIENLESDGKSVIDLESNFFEVDLCNYRDTIDVFDKVRPDYVIHLADVVAGIDYVFRKQGELFRINNFINSNVFMACRDICEGLKGVLYVGTACSFPLSRQNSLQQAPLKEEELFPALPESAYGWSKLIGQLEIGYLEKECGVNCCTLMFHNVYGFPTDFGERSQVIPALIRKAVNYPNEEFIVWGSGTQARAFVYIDDIIEAIVAALDKGWGHGNIQIGPDFSSSIKEIAELVVDISGKNIEIVYDDSKPEGDKARSADYSKAKKLLNWEPRITLRKGLESTYEWIEAQIKK